MGREVTNRYITTLAVFCSFVFVSPVVAQDPIADKVQQSFALVKTANGVGSAFIVEMDGKKYLVTNDHVMRGGRPFSVRLISGGKIETTGIEVANTRNLVRLPLAEGQDLPALTITGSTPRMGTRVGVYGNSDGAAVMTALTGKINGVGPEVVEISAKFVRGNSGSPIVLPDGTVAAVATFATLNPEPDDWTKKGTRFSKVRRFGVRLTGVKWVPLTEDAYFARIDHLVDMQTLCHDVYALYFTNTYFDKQKGMNVYSSHQQAERYRTCKDFPRFLEDLLDGFYSTVKRSALLAKKQAGSKSSMNARMSRHGGENQEGAELNYARARVGASLTRYMEGAGKKLLPRLSRLALKNDWKTEAMKSEAEFWLNVFKAFAVPE